MRRSLFPGLLASLLLTAGVPAQAGVTVGFDVATLNELLPALSAQEIVVPVTDSRSVSVYLEEMRVTGLEPGAGENGSGRILTAMRVRIPQLGIDLPLQPRISLHVVEEGAASVLELRFDTVEVPLFVGELDVAPFLPPVRMPAENLWLMEGATGDVRVRSRLTGIEMGRNVVRFEFGVETLGPE